VCICLHFVGSVCICLHSGLQVLRWQCAEPPRVRVRERVGVDQGEIRLKNQHGCVKL
jgi:hypothetical protein